ncbi:hypothetical protein E1301_Tti021316 [Triplophysa tibetana]|uniref:Uncharacterized protein n=1 Tax=Triplophysa tibetana TaxID=1572043 RepID=A0A5A9MXM2_9TELE|nr:hypothetical protein E1301_Tti021316 [Triplophysa tibetana]
MPISQPQLQQLQLLSPFILTHSPQAAPKPQGELKRPHQDYAEDDEDDDTEIKEPPEQTNLRSYGANAFARKLLSKRNPSRLFHCLKWGKTRTKIEQHLRSTCLRDVEDGRLQEEVSRAKESQDKWAREGSAATQQTEVFALVEEHMGEVSNRLRRHQVVPAKSKTEFRTFCIATLMWVHRLGPTRIVTKVEEWNDRVTEGDSVLVKLSKGSMRLSKKEEYESVAPDLQEEQVVNSPRTSDMDEERFSVNSALLGKATAPSSRVLGCDCGHVPGHPSKEPPHRRKLQQDQASRTATSTIIGGRISTGSGYSIFLVKIFRFMLKTQSHIDVMAHHSSKGLSV